MLARQIRRLRPGLVLLQHPDDLIFREPCSLHLSVLQEGRTLNPRGGKSQWQVTSLTGLPSKTQDARGKQRHAATSSNWALSRCQPLPAPGRYSLISTWRKVSAGRSNIAAILIGRETRNDGNGEASTTARPS